MLMMKQEKVRWLKLTCRVLAVLLTVLFGLSTQIMVAQGQQLPQPSRQPATSAASPPVAAASSTPPAATVAASAAPVGVSAAADERYRIGPGDVLDIRVFNRPQLSRDSVRVDGGGMIQMPLLEGDIQAACLTEVEIANQIANRYLKYQRNPYVNVFIKEYNSKPVAVIGAVGRPGQFQLQRRVRLLELLSFAGGPSERAGSRVQIVHTAGTLRCESPSAATESAGDDVAKALVFVKLNETLRGEDKANPYVQPGDIISLPEADQAFIVGNVLRPSAIPLRETITVSRAIAIAGGTLPGTNKDKVRIIRQVPGTLDKTEIIVALKAIDKRKAEDVVLQPGDIVDVPPTSGATKVLKDVLRTIVPVTAAALPTRVIR